MNILITDSWLREYLDTKATPQQIMDCLSLCGPSVERINKKTDDFVYDIEITSNRIDMASVYGIAREAAVILPRFKIPAKLKQLHVNSPAKPLNNLPMTITDEHRICHRIMGIVMEVNKVAHSPEFIKQRLENSGIRSLNNLVDITNYVMIETGHPCHVFDYDRVKTHKFIIRKAQKGEPIITLDNKKYLLDSEDVVIDDSTGRIIDLPGIMGTENSVVTDKTERIIFFIESNNPVLIRKTSFRYGIRTMAATINEKHPDANLVQTAFFRGVELYKKYAGGREAGELIDIFPHKDMPKEILISKDFVIQKLGIGLDLREMEAILFSLGFKIIKTSSDSLKVTPPTYRQYDVSIPEDLVEEIARIYGYHNLPSQLMTGAIPITSKSEILMLESKIKNLLKGFGYTETYNYSFTDKNTLIKSGLDPNKHLKLANPLTEDFVYLRTSLLPSLLNNINLNQNLSDDLKLFEMANVYNPQTKNLPKEISSLAVICQSSIFHLKGIIETLFREIGIDNYHISPSHHHFFNKNFTLSYYIGENLIANIGKIDSSFKNEFALNQEIYAADISLNDLAKYQNKTKKYNPISPFPPVIEDLTLIMPDKTNIGPVLNTIKKLSVLISNLMVINSYQNRITVRITYHDDKGNLSNSQVKSIRTEILQILNQKYSIKIP